MSHDESNHFKSDMDKNECSCRKTEPARNIDAHLLEEASSALTPYLDGLIDLHDAVALAIGDAENRGHVAGLEEACRLCCVPCSKGIPAWQHVDSGVWLHDRNDDGIDGCEAHRIRSVMSDICQATESAKCNNLMPEPSEKHMEHARLLASWLAAVAGGKASMPQSDLHDLACTIASIEAKGRIAGLKEALQKCEELEAHYEATSTTGRILGANACVEAINSIMTNITNADVKLTPSKDPCMRCGDKGHVYISCPDGRRDCAVSHRTPCPYCKPSNKPDVKMTLADELATFAATLYDEERVGTAEYEFLCRATQALRAASVTAARLSAVWANLNLTACRLCGHLHQRHHVCYECGHDNARPIAATEE